MKRTKQEQKIFNEICDTQKPIVEGIIYIITIIGIYYFGNLTTAILTTMLMAAVMISFKISELIIVNAGILIRIEQPLKEKVVTT